MWLKFAKNNVINNLLKRMIHTAQAISQCVRCGTSLKKFANGSDYYCSRCYANGYSVVYHPSSSILTIKERDSKRLVYEGPWISWTNTAESTPSVSTPPIQQRTLTCKIDESNFVQSQFRADQLYCPTCWSKNGLITEYTPGDGIVVVKDKDSRALIYQGPYSEWQGKAEVKAFDQTGVPSTATPSHIPVKSDEDQTEVNIENAVTASGEYANGQPEADLVQGQIRIFSDEHMAEIPIDSENIMGGMKKVSSTIGEGLDQYVKDQHFLYLSQSGDERFTDIYTSPIILDSAQPDPDSFINSVVSENPLYQYTEIGSKGYTPNISQANAISVIANTSKNLILCFPTGAGKTACAEAAIAKGILFGKTPETAEQISIQNPIAIYVCPARALAAQIAKDFSNPEHPFAKAGWSVRIEQGVRQIDSPKENTSPDDEDTDVGAADDAQLRNLAITENASIIVATPERLLSCLMNPKIYNWVSRISTMIFDEGHLLGDESRGAKFEGEQIHLYKDHYRRIKATPIGQQCSIIFMSATMQNALELSAWQSNTTQDPDWSVVWGEYKPVPITQEFRDYEISKKGPSEEDLAKDMLRDIVSRENYCTKRQANGAESETMRPTLVFFHVKRRAYLMQRVAENLFRECQNKNCGYVFEATSMSGKPMSSDDERCPVCNSSVSEWKINFHHASVRSGDQKRYVDEFNSGERKVLLATSTLAAGVNTGAMSVYIGGTSRGPNDISPSEIGQMRGRAGRQSFAHMYPDQAARVVIYTEKDRSTYHRRRIQAGAYLESMMVDPIYIVDNILRAVKMGSISNFNEAGTYIASSLAYFQSRVDNRHKMNIRQSLKEISRSIDGANNDRIEWMSITDPSCQHGDLKMNERSMAESSDDEESFDWHVVCKECGSEGLMEQEFRPLTDEDFLGMIDSSLRDLIGSGFLVVMPDGQIKITSLGKDIVRSHMESATAVDIVRNMIGFDPETTSAMDVAIAIGNVRANNDERRGCYISTEQAAECKEALARMGLDEKSAFPAVKNIQCLLWSLNGTTIDQVPDCLRADFMSIPDNYGGPFLTGFGSLAKHAGWFNNAGDLLSQIQVQLKKQVSPQQVPFAVVHMVGAVTANALEKAGFRNLHDIINSNDVDIRWADFCFYRFKWHLKSGRILPSSKPGSIDNWMRERMSKGATEMRASAAAALEGKKRGGDGKMAFDSEYKRMVNLLNSEQFLSRIGY